MAGPIATMFGLGAEEDQINATIGFFRNPWVAGTLGGVTGLLVFALGKVALEHPAAQAAVEIVLPKKG